LGTAYPSLTADQWESIVSSDAYPTTPYAQVNLYDGEFEYVAVAGTATMVADPTSEEFDTNFTLTMQRFDPSSGAITGPTTQLTGNGTPPDMCLIEFLE
jgi:hypothetical protein